MAYNFLMGILEALQQNNLSYQLTPISLRDLIYLRNTPCDIFGYVGGRFEIIIEKNSTLDKFNLNKIAAMRLSQIFIKTLEISLVQQLNREKLLQRTRALSIGDLWQNLKTEINLLLIQLGQLYKDPHHDEILSVQYQSLKNIVKILIEHDQFIPELYKHTLKSNHHYTIMHPLLSSLFLLGFLQRLTAINAREKELLFITNYFKDIGMASIPKDIFDKKKLTDSEKTLLTQHSIFSKKILQGRIPIQSGHLNIIEKHHLFSKLREVQEDISGINSIESILIHISDTITAMVVPRPYRKQEPLFPALTIVKNLMEREYYSEFKVLVTFVQFFFKQ